MVMNIEEKNRRSAHITLPSQSAILCGISCDHKWFGRVGHRAFTTHGNHSNKANIYSVWNASTLKWGLRFTSPTTTRSLTHRDLRSLASCGCPHLTCFLQNFELPWLKRRWYNYGTEVTNMIDAWLPSAFLSMHPGLDRSLCQRFIATRVPRPHRLVRRV
jgi:hypothetical protein